MNERIFISKNASEVTALNHFLSSKGITLRPHSFLEFNPSTISINDPFDVIFFGSPRAVYYFDIQMKIPTSVQIACVGSATGEVIKKLGRHVDFEGIGEIGAVGKNFKSWCGNRKVLFPLSNISLKTISSLFDPSQKIEIEILPSPMSNKVTPFCLSS